MTEIFGYIGAFLTTISFLPQAIQTIKTRNTDGISLLMYSLFTLGVVFWLLYGLLLENLIIIVANIIVFILAAPILIIKIKNVSKPKHPQSPSARAQSPSNY